MIRGEYGRTPMPTDPEFVKKIVGDAEVITCRPADKLAPELAKQKAEAGELAKCEEDVLSYALFPQVAKTFLAEKYNPKPAYRELFVEDLGN